MRGSRPTTSPIRHLATFALAAAALGGVVAPAQAATKTLDYECVYPYLGPQPLTVTYDAVVGAQAPLGKALGDTPVDAALTLGGSTSALTQLVGAASLEGRLSAPLTVTSPGQQLLRSLDLEIPRTLSLGLGDLALRATGSFASVSYPTAGAGQLAVDAPVLTLAALTDSGAAIELTPDDLPQPQTDDDPSTFEVACTPNPSTQSPVLSSFTVASIDDTLAPTPPGTPSVTQLSDRSATISWGASTDPTTLSYEVSVGGRTLAAAGTSVRVSGLEPSTDYAVTVRAKDAAINRSPASQATSFRTTGSAGDSLPPTQPRGLSASELSDTSVKLKWSASTDDVGVVGYDVVQGSTVLRTVTGLETVVGGLSPSSTYAFEIVAKDAAGNRKPSNPLTITTGKAGGGQIPTRPAFIRVTEGVGSLDLRWGGATDDTGIVRYEVSLDNGTTPVIRSTTETTASLTGLTPGGFYAVEVRAFDAAGNRSDAILWVGQTLVTPKPTPAPIPGTKTLAFDCALPFAGRQQVQVDFGATQQRSAQGLTEFALVATARFTPETQRAFELAGFGTLEGLVEANSSLRNPALDAPRSFDLRYFVGKRPVVDSITGEGLTYEIGGPSWADGAYDWTIDDLVLKLEARAFSGASVLVDRQVFPEDGDDNPGTFAASCSIAPSTQDTRFKRLQFSRGVVTETAPVVTPVPTPTPTPKPGSTPTPTPLPTPAPNEQRVAYEYFLAGSATLRTLTKGSLPLSGSIAATIGVSSGAITADLALQRASGNLTALGFLPVTAKVDMVPTEPVRGSLKNGKLTAVAKVRIKLPSVKTFGIELAGGANCQAKQVSSITLTSTQPTFLPLTGGPIAGTFGISDLSGCGFLTGIVSPLTKGDGNAIALNLTPVTR